MRKRFRVLLIATFVAAVAGRFGYALSVEPTPKPAAIYPGTRAVARSAATVVSSPVLVHSAPRPATSAAPAIDPVPGAGKLLLVGSFLFGLSAIVRKAI